MHLDILCEVFTACELTNSQYSIIEFKVNTNNGKYKEPNVGKSTTIIYETDEKTLYVSENLCVQICVQIQKTEFVETRTVTSEKRIYAYIHTHISMQKEYKKTKIRNKVGDRE